MRHYTPLRYPGGKGRLLPFVVELIKYNGLRDITYVEPYAGGAGLALGLLLQEHAWRIVINDIDPAIHAFWHTVLNDSQWLIDRINTVQVDMQQWHIQREILYNPTAQSRKALGFAALFMNRTNRSGILCGGAIGGKDQTGNFKIDARFYRKTLTDRINLIAQYRSRISVSNLDAVQFLDKVIPALPENSLVYLDPPYYSRGRKLYINDYKKEDHQEVATMAQSIKTPWMVTYDHCPGIKLMYGNEQVLPFRLTYSANDSRPVASEYLFYGNCDLPDRIAFADQIYIARSGRIDVSQSAA